MTPTLDNLLALLRDAPRPAVIDLTPDGHRVSSLAGSPEADQLAASVRVRLPLGNGRTCRAVLRSPLHPRQQLVVDGDAPRGAPVIADAQGHTCHWAGETPDGWAIYVPPSTDSWAPAARLAAWLGFPDPGLTRLLPSLRAAIAAWAHLDTIAVNLLLPAGASGWADALRGLAGDTQRLDLRTFQADDDGCRRYLAAPPPAHLTIVGGLTRHAVRLCPEPPPQAILDAPVAVDGWRTWPAGSPERPACWLLGDDADDRLPAQLAAGRQTGSHAAIFATVPQAALALLQVALTHSGRVLLTDPLIDAEWLQRTLATAEPPVLVAAPPILLQPAPAYHTPLRRWLAERGLADAAEPLIHALARNAPWLLAAEPPAPSLQAEAALALLLTHRLPPLADSVVLPTPDGAPSVHFATRRGQTLSLLSIDDAPPPPIDWPRAVALAVAAGRLTPRRAGELLATPPAGPIATHSRRLRLDPGQSELVAATANIITLSPDGVRALLADAPLPDLFTPIADRWWPQTTATPYRREAPRDLPKAADPRRPYGRPPEP